MENPQTWGEAEKTIHKAMRDAELGRARGLVGLSAAAQVANALRCAGLLSDKSGTLLTCRTCQSPMEVLQTCGECGTPKLAICKTCNPDRGIKSGITA